MRFRFAGRFVHESTRTKSKTLAREAERQRRRELEETWNKIERRTLPPSFEQAADAWLEHVKPHLAERTQDIYDVALRCHLKQTFGRKLLCDIDASEIAAYQAKRKTERASSRTLNKELQVLRQVLKRHKLWATLQGEVKFEREHAGVGRALTPEEESKLLQACGANVLLNTVVTIALHTALRKNEIRTLRWSQIDLFKQTLTVGHSKTEGGSGRLIPLNSVAYAALVRWAKLFPKAKQEHYVFPACEDARLDCPKPNSENIDASCPIKSWRTAWRRATSLIECPACGRLQKAGAACSDETCKTDIRKAKSLFARLRFHDLRHACITKLAESQTSEHTIMAIAGHLSRNMLEHYSHIRMAAKRAALDAIVKQPHVADFKEAVNQNVNQLQNSDSHASAN